MIHSADSTFGVLIEKRKTKTNDSGCRYIIRLGKNVQRTRMEFPWDMRFMS